MTVDAYRQNHPDYNYHDDVVEECLIRAECTVNVLSHGSDIDPDCREEAIAAQTRFLLKHYDEEPGDCEEAGLSTISALARAGILL